MSNRQHGIGRLLNEQEAAAELGISPRKLWDYAKAGAIPVVRLGGRKLYDPHDLAGFVSRMKTNAVDGSAVEWSELTAVCLTGVVADEQQNKLEADSVSAPHRRKQEDPSPGAGV